MLPIVAHNMSRQQATVLLCQAPSSELAPVGCCPLCVPGYSRAGFAKLAHTPQVPCHPHALLASATMFGAHTMLVGGCSAQAVHGVIGWGRVGVSPVSPTHVMCWDHPASPLPCWLDCGIGDYHCGFGDQGCRL